MMDIADGSWLRAQQCFDVRPAQIRVDLVGHDLRGLERHSGVRVHEAHLGGEGVDSCRILETGEVDA